MQTLSVDSHNILHVRISDVYVSCLQVTRLFPAAAGIWLHQEMQLWFQQLFGGVLHWMVLAGNPADCSVVAASQQFMCSLVLVVLVFW